ncbi:MAG TPA: hydantoinase B/oxoprolinase family protein [Aquamicrobium sp.]|nr:hydantoinase B/oxoprolinase family protein [Aquamicrobium sp.]
MKLDAAERAIIADALIACAREMGEKLFRSAFSTVVREARDASASVLDAQGAIVAQADLIPMHLGSMDRTIRPCLEAFPRETWEPGDVFITNHPYQGGQHLPDIFIFTPVIVDDQLIGFAATIAHHIEIGGGALGPNMFATDLHQEGVIIPPTKINLARDWNGGPFERLFRANIRVPDQVIGDLNAQIAANSVGESRLAALCRKYGADAVKSAMSDLMDYSERRFRSAIAAAPNGTWTAEDSIDDDGFTDEPRTVRVRVTIADDEIVVDFTGTDAQLRSNLNAPLSSTISAALSCLKSVLTEPDLPFNSGCARAVRFVVPEGTMINPHYPAPNRARMEVCYRVFNAIMRALAAPLPDRVIAGGYDSTVSFSLSRLDGDSFRVCMEVFGGGYGASSTADGCDAVDSPLSNCANTPVESLDMEYPYFQVCEYSLRDGSGGEGIHRGGLGFVRHYRILNDDVQLVFYSDRFRNAPEGLRGGLSGQPGGLELIRSGATLPPVGKYTGTLRTGDEIRLFTGGGAGFGTPSS